MPYKKKMKDRERDEKKSPTSVILNTYLLLISTNSMNRIRIFFNVARFKSDMLKIIILI